MSDKTGGPAFPVDRIGSEQLVSSCGMPLRDYFAAHASEDDIKSVMGTYANPRAATRQQARYMHADAMLQERVK